MPAEVRTLQLTRDEAAQHFFPLKRAGFLSILGDVELHGLLVGGSEFRD
jgi:hypothetical protein